MNQPVYLLADFSLQITFTLLLQFAGMRSGYAQTGATWVQANSLKRVSHMKEVIYASAIALRLAPKVYQPPNEIAHDLSHALQAQIDHAIHGWSILRLPLPHHSMVLAGVTIQATETGLLHFFVHDRAITAWLDGLLQMPLALPTAEISLPTQPFLSPQDQFQIQHTHARCCSLLELAEQQGLIELARQSSEVDPFFWRIIQPTPIPWLTASGCLQLSDSADRQLIQALVSAIDYLVYPLSITPEGSGRQALTVCQAFQAAHRVHPLLANKTSAALPCIVAYLALVRVTQQVLFHYLRILLNLPAPPHL